MEKINVWEVLVKSRYNNEGVSQLEEMGEKLESIARKMSTEELTFLIDSIDSSDHEALSILELIAHKK